MLHFIYVARLTGGKRNVFHCLYRYSNEDLEMLEKQCEVFYTETMSNGIKGAFVEDTDDNME